MSSPRRLPCSPPAAPLDVDDLLAEILLRLPPQPSSLPRASAVCKRWRLLVSDRRFLRRFRIHHRGNPALLGCFDTAYLGLGFHPSLEFPNRVPSERFSFQRDRDDPFVNSVVSFGCRHGLVLISELKKHQFVVWDPVTGEEHQLAISPGFDRETTGSVLRVAGDVHFQVVFVASRNRLAFACIYSSETGVWGDLVSTLIPTKDEADSEEDYFCMMLGTRVSREPAVLVEGSLYWICGSYIECNSILEFDLQKQSLDVIQVPVDVDEDACNFKVIRADGGGLGFLFVSDFTAQLWKRNTDYNGVASWVLGRTIELDKLLSLNTETNDHIMILGYAEENNAVFLWAFTGVYEVQLKTLQFKLFRTDFRNHCHPFESVYTAETDIAGEHDGAELLHNA